MSNPPVAVEAVTLAFILGIHCSATVRRHTQGARVGCSAATHCPADSDARRPAQPTAAGREARASCAPLACLVKRRVAAELTGKPDQWPRAGGNRSLALGAGQPASTFFPTLVGLSQGWIEIQLCPTHRTQMSMR